MLADRRRSYEMIETLESRRLFSTTILGPSAVEGNYKGDVVYDGTTAEIKLTITSTSATLTLVGVGSRKVALTSKEFKELREGTFAYSGSIKGVAGEFEGSVLDGGQRIDGSFTGTYDSDTITGTFAVKKY